MDGEEKPKSALFGDQGASRSEERMFRWWAGRYIESRHEPASASRRNAGRRKSRRGDHRYNAVHLDPRAQGAKEEKAVALHPLWPNIFSVDSLSLFVFGVARDLDPRKASSFSSS